MSTTGEHWMINVLPFQLFNGLYYLQINVGEERTKAMDIYVLWSSWTRNRKTKAVRVKLPAATSGCLAGTECSPESHRPPAPLQGPCEAVPVTTLSLQVNKDSNPGLTRPKALRHYSKTLFDILWTSRKNLQGPNNRGIVK